MSISVDIAARAADRLRVQSQTGLWSLHDLIGRQSPLLHACLLPKPAGKLHGIDSGGLPPGAFVARPMHGPVMYAAERDRKFIAGFAAERAWLQKSKMMWIRRLAATYKAWLSSDKAQVLAVTIAPRCGNREHALVDATRLVTSSAGSLRLLLRRRLCGRGTFARGNAVCNGRREARHFLLERVLEEFGIARNEAVFGGGRAGC